MMLSVSGLQRLNEALENGNGSALPSAPGGMCADGRGAAPVACTTTVIGEGPLFGPSWLGDAAGITSASRGAPRSDVFRLAASEKGTALAAGEPAGAVLTVVDRRRAVAGSGVRYPWDVDHGDRIVGFDGRPVDRIVLERDGRWRFFDVDGRLITSCTFAGVVQVEVFPDGPDDCPPAGLVRAVAA